LPLKGIGLTSKRGVQVGSAIHESLAKVFARGGVSDPRLKGLTILGVKVSPDMQLAKVYFSSMGGKSQEANVRSGLKSASGFLRKHLGEELGLRYTPQLVFYFDETPEKAARIEEIFTQIRAEPKLENLSEAAASASSEVSGG
jgi:ribosome-binding factor A